MVSMSTDLRIFRNIYLTKITPKVDSTAYYYYNALNFNMS